MSKRVRTRSLGSASYRTIGRRYIKPGGPSPSVDTYLDTSGSLALGDQITIDSENSWYANRGSKGDVGGDFYTKRRSIDLATSSVATRTNPYPSGPPQYGTYDERVGPWFPGPVSGVAYCPPSLESSDSSLRTIGSTAISRSAPGNPLVQLDVSLGEGLKDGLPTIPFLHSLEKRASIVKQAGAEFLNLAFGWAPLLSDVKSVARACAQMDDEVRNYVEHSGVRLRRRYSFPTDSSSGSTLSGNVYPLPIGGGPLAVEPGTPGQIEEKTSRYISRWFSGCFTYYLSDSVRSELSVFGDESRHLLGLDLTPETLWNLAPWSWMIDWVSNVGDVISNISRFQSNGLVMHYGYIMEHTIHERRQTYVGPPRYRGLTSSDISSVSYKTETKKRLGADPYGFGLSWQGLSAFQKSVLIALGLSHSR